jgi:hypothetical protein
MDSDWIVIRMLRDRALPRFQVFKGETWTTLARKVGATFELGAGELRAGVDFEVVYQGDRSGTQAHEATKVLRRCEFHACTGCSTCGGQFNPATRRQRDLFGAEVAHG